MKPSRSLLLLVLTCSGLAGLNSLRAADSTKAKKATAGESGEQLIFHTEWKGERITLPPPFAPAMKLRGLEEIRFAPGMFRAQADSFFSYAFVFSVAREQELTAPVIQRELLAYYRGLAESVSKSKGAEVNAGKFTFKLVQAKEAAGTPEKIPTATSVTQYAGELDWVEPFVTAKPQSLHFEIQSWAEPATARNYLFVCTSPRASAETDEVWRELRKLRRSFEVSSKPAD